MTKELPSPDTLRQLLLHNPNTGKLFWLARPPEMFSDDYNADIAAHRWNARFAGKEAFTRTCNHGYFGGSIFYKYYKTHRVIWALHFGAWPDGQIDHINGIRGDNKILNLRDVPAIINARNAKLCSNNTSGHNGVCWDKRTSKWKARIRKDGKAKTIGLYKNIEDAVLARKNAEFGLGYTDRHGTEQ